MLKLSYKLAILTEQSAESQLLVTKYTRYVFVNLRAYGI